MLEITDAARREIAFRLKGEAHQPLRIYVEESGCAGPSFMITRDVVRDTDERYTINGFQYVVDRELMAATKPIKVDFGLCSFNISSAMQSCQGCSACGAAGWCASGEKT